ncbi:MULTISPECIES: hypothetical protein [unclassified Psychrobacter]|uniref:hypothetical protein n=1 Tax=unclassified Psychrobacter TaxID=196806 RepID=UPI0025B376C2|nr:MULTISPECIES: hypothetical protein [unclassified Psychrobacter]MDN3452876.1 hypothetical protein [Psychrobacter sp. APC 3350]MDN3502602.1 hypothetical protein [Psychrobacter sp. 5A.1]
MNTFRRSLITVLSSAITASKNIGYAGQTVLAISLVALPVVVQATTYQTYVIHTYGGDTLLPAVRQQLNSSRDGGTVTTYQDKLVLNTTAANYQAVQQLLTQIDRQPQALTVTVRVGNNSSTQNNIQQGQVIITNRGIQGSGIINQRNSQQQGSNSYQIKNLSGSAASISTGTLYSLTQAYSSNRYANNYNLKPQIIIQQQVLLPTTQGIAVTPRLLPTGQVEVQLAQVEETLVQSNSPYNRSSSANNAIQSQRLNSTIIVPRGQWITIGQISQTSQNQSTSYGGNQAISSNNSVPISLLVQ